MKSKKSFKGTALITGSARRVGRAISLHLSSLGYRIALHYNSSKREAQSVADLLKNNGGACEIFDCDLSNEKATTQLIKRVYTRFSDLNILINNASIFEPSDFIHEPLIAFNKHMATNLKAPYILTYEFAKHVKTGNIINILDTSIVKNRTRYFAYLLSKKSLAELTMMSAIELAPKIRVNAVAPGFILPPAKGKLDLKNKLKNIPLQTQGNVEQISQSIEFLINNPYLTGQIIFNDGGEHLLSS